MPRPADGIDNDCDGIQDEEYLDGVDNDGDGVKDEDITVLTQPNLAPYAFASTSTTFNAGAGLTQRSVTERFALPAYDVEGDTLTWSVLSTTRGTATVSGSVLSFTDHLQSGSPTSATIQVRSSDGVLNSNTVAVTLSHNGFDYVEAHSSNTECETTRPSGTAIGVLCNEPPFLMAGTAASATISVPPGEVVHYASTVWGQDPDLDPITYQLETAPSGMTIDATGNIRWDISQVSPLLVASASDAATRAILRGLSGGATREARPSDAA